jgi:hypothetical protein
MPVVTEFIMNVQRKEEAACHAKGKSKNIDE